MQTNKILSATFFFALAAMLAASIVPTPTSQAQPDTITIKAASGPPAVLDTVPVPAIVERIAEKTQLLKQGIKTINKNSIFNQKQAEQLDKQVSQLAGVVEIPKHDTVVKKEVVTRTVPIHLPVRTPATYTPTRRFWYRLTHLLRKSR